MLRREDTWDPSKHTVCVGLSSTCPWWALSWGSEEGFHFLILVSLSEHSGTCYRAYLLPQTSWFVIPGYDTHSLKTKPAWSLLCLSIFKEPLCLPLAVVGKSLGLACFLSMFLSVPLCFPLWVLPTLAGWACLTGKNPTIFTFHCLCSSCDENNYNGLKHL